jgi:hypothetical protein
MVRFVEDFIKEEPSADQITRIGMDTSKRFFQLHGVDAEGRPALRRQLTRAQLLPFFEKLAPTLVAMEACGAAHPWARAAPRRSGRYRPGERRRRESACGASGSVVEALGSFFLASSLACFAARDLRSASSRSSAARALPARS